MEGLVVNQKFWKNRNVFITGHTGFKGTWLVILLNQLGAKVNGYALSPDDEQSIFNVTKSKALVSKHQIGNVVNLQELTVAMKQGKPDVVIHLAAQSLVKKGYLEPVETYQTNVMGSLNVLEAVRNTPSVRVVLNVTSDKCYTNSASSACLKESAPLGGKDPYSSSKGCSELITNAYQHSFLDTLGMGVATARSGNVIGGGDYASDRIVPDVIRAINANHSLQLRQPQAIRPWCHVLETLSGYLCLCEHLYRHPQQYSGSWNFGPYQQNNVCVQEIVTYLYQQFGQLLNLQASDSSSFYESICLKLDITKALQQLPWQPKWNVYQALNTVVSWEKQSAQGCNMQQVAQQEITHYLHAAITENVCAEC